MLKAQNSLAASLVEWIGKAQLTDRGNFLFFNYSLSPNYEEFSLHSLCQVLKMEETARRTFHIFKLVEIAFLICLPLHSWQMMVNAETWSRCKRRPKQDFQNRSPPPGAPNLPPSESTLSSYFLVLLCLFDQNWSSCSSEHLFQYMKNLRVESSPPTYRESKQTNKQRRQESYTTYANALLCKQTLAFRKNVKLPWHHNFDPGLRVSVSQGLRVSGSQGLRVSKSPGVSRISLWHQIQKWYSVSDQG